LVPYEKVVAELNRDLVSYSSSAGISGSFYRLIDISMKTDAERYKLAVEWMHHMLYDVQFLPERIRVVAQQYVNSAAEEKRDGWTVVNFLMKYLIYEKGSQLVLYDLIYQEKYLKGLLDRLEKEPEKVIANFDTLKSMITTPDRLVQHILCDAEKLNVLNVKPHDAYVDFLPEDFKKENRRYRSKILGGCEPTYLKAADAFGQGLISAIGSCESCYVLVVAPCQLRHMDKDMPALKLLLQYFSQCEGPIWREIRGGGLAYGANLSLSLDHGYLKFNLYRTSNPVQAYAETKRIVNEHLADEDGFDEDEFEAAKRSLIFEIVDKEETIKGASVESLLSYYRGVSTDYNRQLLKRIWEVEMDELKVVGEKYLKSLFNFESSSTAITCHPSKLNEIKEGFKELGGELRVVTLEDEELYAV